MSARVSLPCPTCGGPLPSEVPESGLPTNKWPHRPFCSDRCRLIDLGKWFDGKYVIPGPPADPEEAERNGS